MFDIVLVKSMYKTRELVKILACLSQRTVEPAGFHGLNRPEDDLMV